MNKLNRIFDRLGPFLVVLALVCVLIVESFAFGHLLAWLVGGSSVVFGFLWLALSMLALAVVIGGAIGGNDDF